MAICTTCGAASAEGAAHCAACGAAFAAVPAPAGAGPAIGEPELVGGGHPDGPDGPDGDGSEGDGAERWGGGREVAPRRWSGLLDLLTGPGWWRVLGLVAATTGLLLLVGLLFGIGLDGVGGADDGFGGPGLAGRFGVGLAVVLAAFGGPLTSRSDYSMAAMGGDAYHNETSLTVQLVPMTVTLLWLLLFGHGLRRWAGVSIRQAVRAVLLAVLAGGLLALLAGSEQTLAEGAGAEDFTDGSGHSELTVGLLGPLLGTAVLAGLAALWVCRGSAALRERAPAWSAAVAGAGRGAGLVVGLSALVAVVVLAVTVPLKVALAGLMVLPNLGLALLGFGGGVGVHLGSTGRGPGQDEQEWESRTFSLFDRGELTGQWGLAPLLLVAAAVLLALSVRRLDRPARLRAAGLLWIGLTLLTAVAGGRYEMAFRMSGAGTRDEPRAMVTEFAIGMGVFPLLALHLALAVVAVLVLPELLDRFGGRGGPESADDPGPAEDDPIGLELTASGTVPAQGTEVLDFGKR
ncbi:hypothetical protein ACIRBX_30085 [Kitasatospora sp. NPDC096147]|uniref:hypothetical protein n=1 Tax=Kitasatospora sp. NPDC096147 TaxID=3364093 RepID=UPI003820A7A7